MVYTELKRITETILLPGEKHENRNKFKKLRIYLGRASPRQSYQQRETEADKKLIGSPKGLERMKAKIIVVLKESMI